MLGWRVLLFFQFFRKYLTPEERADVIIVAMEAMTGGDLNNALAATKMLKVILKCPVTEVAKVGVGGHTALEPLYSVWGSCSISYQLELKESQVP